MRFTYVLLLLSGCWTRAYYGPTANYEVQSIQWATAKGYTIIGSECRGDGNCTVWIQRDHRQVWVPVRCYGVECAQVRN